MRHGSESESEDGCGPTRRSRSVAPPGRRLLSAAATPLSISTSDLSGGGGRTARASPALCSDHRAPRVCRRPSCAALHVCRLYVDGFCPNSDAACRWGHAVSSEGNRAALAAHQLQALPERELLWLVRALLRQTAPVTAEEYRSQLAVCPQYAAGARCSRPDCFQLHLCPRLASGRCGPEVACRWSHRLTDPDNVMVLLRLRCAELSETEVLDRLARNSDHGDSSSGSEILQTNGIGSTLDSVQQRLIKISKGQGQVRTSTETVVSRAADVDKTLPNATGNNSPDHQRKLALGLNLCRYNIFPARCKEECGKLHLCRLFLGNMCVFGKKCMSGHNLIDSTHNAGILKELGVEHLSEGVLLESIKAGYLARNPVTDLERRFALQVCRPYQGQMKCGQDCSRLHICDEYVAGTCWKGLGCGLSHEIFSSRNAAIVRRVGLHQLGHDELLEVLRRPVASKDVFLCSSGNFVPSSTRRSKGANASRQATPEVPGTCSPKDIRDRALEVNLCRRNIHPSRCIGNCGQMHLCRLFVADMCPNGKRCQSGHTLLTSPHNADVLKECGLERLSEGALLNAIKAGYLARNPITDLERCFALQICHHYQEGKNCGVDCYRFHVCHGYVGGKCANGSGCELSHQLTSSRNNVIVKRVGLYPLGHDELLALLNTTPDAKDVWQSLDLIEDFAVASSDTALLAAGSNGSKTPRHATPEVPTGGPPKDARELALEMNLCEHNFHPSLCTGNCRRLHLCRLFVAGMCPFAEKCVNGHKLLSSSHNAGVVKERGLEQLSEAGLLNAIKDGYIARYPITDLECRLALQTCNAYQDEDGCRDEQCLRLHLCDGYVAGTCSNSSGCGRSHQLLTGNNAANIRRVGLIDLTQKELIKALRARPTARDVLKDFVGRMKVSVSPSSDSNSTRMPSRVVRAPSPAPYDTEGGPSLCATHASGGRCQSDDCNAFHICGFFLADVCRRPDGLCPLGHSFSDGHNQWVLEQHGLGGGSPEDFQCLIDQITWRSHITFHEEAEKEVRMCIPYNSKTGCINPNCGRFHVCNRYLAGTCDGNDCPLLHTLDGSHNRTLRDSLGLVGPSSPDGTSTTVTDRDLTELLRARLGVRPGIYEDLPNWAKRTRASGGCRITLPPVCGSLMAGRRCLDAGCVAIHVCPHFLAGACRRQRCSLGHRLDTESNRRALRLVGRHVTEQNHDSLVQELYAASENVRRSEIYEKLRICIPHNRQGGCNLQSCTNVHICQKFVAGTCEDGHCVLCHVLVTKCNRKSLRLLGLENMEADEVMEMLRAVHGSRSAYVE